MIAQVIVNSRAKQTDKKFDYLIPEELIEKIEIGTRVVVPFGRSNKHVEAYCVRVYDTSEEKLKLKEILSAEDKPVFSEKMLNLIEWMREKYLCTYIDVIKAIVPSGTMIKSEEWIFLTETDAKITQRESEIVDALKRFPQGIEIHSLMQYFEDEDIKPVLKKLEKKNVLKTEYKDSRSISDKTVRIAKLAINFDEVDDAIEALVKQRATTQAKVLETLASCDVISISDLVNFTGCSYNAVTNLKKRGLIEFENLVVMRSHRKAEELEKDVPPELTLEQKSVLEEIKNDILKNRFSQILLHGVTGSGKTEVFMNAINEVIEKGKQAIVLVPEISLTPQMMERFIKRFGERVAVFHSGLSLGERFDEWKKMRDGTADIVIGARSAIFAPFENVGIIIMDEEHESTYKSEMPPRYSTREVAAFRAVEDGAVVIYASATPDINSYYNVKNNKYKLLELKTRINKNPIPQVYVSDMRQELSSGNRSIFSRKLIEEIELNLKNKEQTILLMNRRGFSTFVSCRNCGYVAYCPNCNISLTYHKVNDSLKCHYCGYERNNYKICPKCSSKYIRYFGGGTQKVEEEIKKLFPDATTLRMDVDTTSKQNSHEKILNEFSKNKTDILIGTQMVAKGLDFPDVTLVGVVSADTVLNIDDFRSSERAFDLLEQVCGRAGRAEKLGRAVIQTYSPEHEAVSFAKEHNYSEFYNSEIEKRKVLNYPPYTQMVSVLFTGLYENTVSQCARSFAKKLSQSKFENVKVQILGPVPAAITKIKNKYRWRILIKCDNADRISHNLVMAREECYKNKNFEKIMIVIDKNPNNIY